MSTQAVQPTADNQPATITITRAIYKMDGGLDYVYRILGYVCGTLLLLLGLFITYQVIARKLGGPMAPGMDQLSGYVLAFAGTWAFSYSLRTGSHVRIDVLLPLFSRIHPYMRSAADWLALGSVGFFGAITAWKTWEEVLESYCISNDPATGACIQALTNTYPLTPLWIPQTVVAIGFTMLAFTSFQWMLSMVVRGILEIIHKSRGGDVADLVTTENVQEAASGV
ncbi:MAG: TRAP transporter small permease [Dehalococcoidia bacterium]|nr:TRAP transporter small permease [Dehalococcoidia bacterium]